MVNNNEKIALAASGGAAAGVSLVFGLRELDNQMAQSFLTNKASNASTAPPLLMAQLGNFGSPSAIGGIAAGAAGLGLGLYGAHSGKTLRDPLVNIAVSTFGASALTTGIISGVIPTSKWSSAVAVDPSNAIGFNRRASLRIPSNSGARIAGTFPISTA